jgi:hypothetical protein
MKNQRIWILDLPLNSHSRRAFFLFFSFLFPLFLTYTGCENPTNPLSDSLHSSDLGTSDFNFVLDGNISDATDLSLLNTLQAKKCDELQEEAFFDRKIRPLIAEGQEPSCARCHLPGVDFRPFIQEDECQTIACLDEENLVNLTNPEESKMLSWIVRGHELLNVHIEDDPLVQAEYNAFISWITYQAKCGTLLCVDPINDPCNRALWEEGDQGVPLTDLDPPTLDAQMEPNEMGAMDMGVDLGDSTYSDDMMMGADMMRSDMMMGSDMIAPVDLCSNQSHINQFTNTVWTLHGRCYHCHADRYSAQSTQRPRPAPWMSNNRGDMGARITAMRLLESTYLDLETPAQSLILLKPLSTAFGGVDHGGGTKMRNTDDPLYVPLLAWIEQLAACQAEQTEIDSQTNPSQSEED